MTFASIPFLFYFLPLFIAAYYATPAKNAVLLAGSLIFYAWGEPVLVLVLIASTIVNHAMGVRLAVRPRPLLLALGVAANLAALAGFKYLGFLAENVSLLIEALGGPAGAFTLETRLPLGISFFTFQSISFLIDINRRDAPAPRRWVDTALFIAMFPQLIAGPIVRFKTVEGQIRERKHTPERFADGARLFILGLAQKVLLANVFAWPADQAFGSDPQFLSARAAWAGVICYTLQIYFDFAGYSNMALGLGRMFGFRLPRNFDFPYTAQSVAEFWRRWHITLSQWFRDYLYIPLGGSREGRFRTARNLVIVFLLCGFWHGAAWSFLAWGAYHGVFLVLERTGFGRLLAAAPALARHGYLLVVVALGWVLFRTESLAVAGDYYRALFDFARDAPLRWKHIVSADAEYILVIGVVAALYPLVRRPVATMIGGLARAARRGAGGLAHASPPSGRAAVAAAQTIAGYVGLTALLLLSATLLAGGVYNPFIYFRF
jgi:alginate O-acetyltransferase complex protein AlgI